MATPATAQSSPISRQEKPTTKVLAVISPLERELFFQDQHFQNLADLGCEVKSINSKTIEPDEWMFLLAEERPTILLASWTTPMLPDDLKIDEIGLQYVCYMTGSVRGLVSRRLIENGLTITNWGASISRTIAENALMLVLMGLRRTAHWHEVLHHQGGWNHEACNAGQLSLFGRRVGFHGFGRIARELVALMAPWAPVISTYSPLDSDDLLSEFGVNRCPSLDELFAQNEVVVELAALTPSTHHSVGRKQFDLMPKNAVFVNVGRGAVVDEEALANAAARGNIRVALDVFEQEPLPANSPLRAITNIVLMPHQSGPTHDHGVILGNHAIENIGRFLSGKPVEAQITPSLYDQLT